MPQGFLPPLTLGWNTRDPLSSMRPGFGPIFDNFVVENGVARVRPGWRAWSTGLPGRVDGLLPWAGASRLLFASSGAGIYEVTGGGAVGAAVVSGLTQARWSSIQFSATGGNFLFAFNGTDTPRTYNGTTWATWTGTGVTGGVAWAGASQGRLYVGNPDRLSFFYGGAGAIGGAFTEFPLQGVAQRGGGVAAMTTLSGDGGSGPQTLTVFLTTEDEAIVYAGNDPSAASTWALVGRWRIPRLIGGPHRCVVPYGGDALAITIGGLLPLGALRGGADVQTTLDTAAFTRRIAPAWRQIVVDRANLSGWNVTPLPSLGLVVVNAPWSATAAQQIVISEDGAVSRWVGLPAAVWAEFNGRMWFGDIATGRVALFGEDSSDNGAGVRSEALTGFSALGAPGRMKHGKLVQAVLSDAAAVQMNTKIVADWGVPIPQADALGAGAAAPGIPPFAGAGGALVWDTSLWDGAVWAGESGVTRAWRTASAEGHAMAIRLQMVSGYSRPRWLGTNIVYEAGGPVR